MNGRGTRLDDVRLLLELGRDVSASLDLQEVLDKGLAALNRIIEFDGGSIQLIEGDSLRLIAAVPEPTQEALAFRLPIGQGFGGRVAQSGEPIYSADATVDPRAHPEGRRRASTAGVRTYYAAPLIEHGQPVGIVQLDSRRVDAFPPDAQALVLSFLPTITAAVQNARLFGRELETINELREVERLKSDFLAIVSHELRTPLTTVLGFAHTLADKAGRIDPGVISDIAGRIVRASEGLARAIEDLLTLSQVERRTLRVSIAPTDVGPVVERAAIVFDRRDVVADIAPGLPRVVADAERLEQVLGNLISNAERFSPAGSPIQVRARREGDHVAVSVQDRGPGIPEELRDRVFERFYQLEPASTRATGGLGIGLYLVKELCALMDAGVTVDGAPGGGTVFTVHLRAAVG